MCPPLLVKSREVGNRDAPFQEVVIGRSPPPRAQPSTSSVRSRLGFFTDVAVPQRGASLPTSSVSTTLVESSGKRKSVELKEGNGGGGPHTQHLSVGFVVLQFFRAGGKGGRPHPLLAAPHAPALPLRVRLGDLDIPDDFLLPSHAQCVALSAATAQHRP